MVKDYVPSRGDVVWINLNPTLVHEQSGKRPALVLSPRKYNELTSVLIACPITSRVKGYPFEVKIKAGKIDGVILSDQVKTLDWQVRKANFETLAPKRVLQETLSKLTTILS